MNLSTCAPVKKYLSQVCSDAKAGKLKKVLSSLFSFKQSELAFFFKTDSNFCLLLAFRFSEGVLAAFRSCFFFFLSYFFFFFFIFLSFFFFESINESKVMKRE